MPALLSSPPALPFFNPLADIDTTTHKLPHWNQADCYCFVTWRLDDAMPASKLEEWKRERDEWLARHPQPWNEETTREYHREFSQRVDDWLDAGHGSCILRQPAVRRIVADALAHFDGQRYNLAGCVIMPNHVHVLLQLHPSHSLAEILHSWKSFSSKAVQKLLGRSGGTLWQPEYWDRLIRNEAHLTACQNYIRDNPEKARLREGEFTLWQKSENRSVGVPPAFANDAGKMPALLSSTLLCVLDGKPVAEISASLTDGADAREAASRPENLGLSFMGITPAGPFDLPFDDLDGWLNQPNAHGRPNSDVLRPYLNGKDINQRARGQWTIDFTGFDENAAALYEKPFACLEVNVRPVRATNNRAAYRDYWWLYAEAREGMRKAFVELSCYIATCRVAKHRIFVRLGSEFLPDSATIVFARSDDFFFGVLHSRIHEVWSLAQGTQLEDRPRYTPTTCFETFPFPWDHRLPPEKLTLEQRAHHDAISAAAKNLDELRSRWLNPPEWTREEILEFPASPGGPWHRFIAPGTNTARYPRLVPRDAECAKQLAKRTLTKLYNDRPAWLADAHAKLDQAVSAAYGFEMGLADQEILARLLSK